MEARKSVAQVEANDPRNTAATSTITTTTTTTSPLWKQRQQQPKAGRTTAGVEPSAEEIIREQKVLEMERKLKAFEDQDKARKAAEEARQQALALKEKVFRFRVKG